MYVRSQPRFPFTPSRLPLHFSQVASSRKKNTFVHRPKKQPSDFTFIFFALFLSVVLKRCGSCVMFIANSAKDLSVPLDIIKYCLRQ